MHLLILWCSGGATVGKLAKQKPKNTSIIIVLQPVVLNLIFLILFLFCHIFLIGPSAVQ